MATCRSAGRFGCMLWDSRVVFVTFRLFAFWLFTNETLVLLDAELHFHKPSLHRCPPPSPTEGRSLLRCSNIRCRCAARSVDDAGLLLLSTTIPVSVVALLALDDRPCPCPLNARSGIRKFHNHTNIA